jgi:hypothetical protein
LHHATQNNENKIVKEFVKASNCHFLKKSNKFGIKIPQATDSTGSYRN